MHQHSLCGIAQVPLAFVHCAFDPFLMHVVLIAPPAWHVPVQVELMLLESLHDQPATATAAGPGRCDRRTEA